MGVLLGEGAIGLDARPGYAWKALGCLVRRVIDELPGEGERVIKAYWTERARTRLSAGGFPAGHAGKVVRWFVSGLRRAGIEAQVVSCHRDRAVFRLPSCPFGFRPGEERLCDVNSTYDVVVMKEVGCDIRYERRVVKGDPYCEARVTLLPD